MDEQVLKLLRKYLNDQCNPEELNQVRAVLSSDTNKYEAEWDTVLQEDAARCISDDKSPVMMPDNEIERLLDRIVEDADVETFRKTTAMRWYAAAASILLLVTAGLAFLSFSSVWDTGEITETITTNDKPEEVWLPDGTRVWLSHQSSVSYPEEFEENRRIVQLDGRAFFEVAEDRSRPFSVQTEGLAINVLGTSFDVSAYDHDPDLTVTVASGSVNVEGLSSIPKVAGPGLAREENLNSGQSPGTLQRGDQITYDRHNRVYFRQTLAHSDIQALREGKLVFQNQSLVNIIQALERRYDVSFKFENESDQRQRLTFKPNSDDLEDILKVLSLVSSLEYDFNGREVLMGRK